MTRLLFTVDTEPDWGASATRGVAEMLLRLLDMLDEREIAATFFVTGSLARSHRDALLGIDPRHEITSHCHTHRRMNDLPRDELRDELRASKAALEALGRDISGIRAPFFLTPDGWLEEAAAAGYRYDASTGCVRPSLANRRPPDADGPMPSLGVSVLRDGITPLCLTYLRLYHPFGVRMLPRPMPGRPIMIYLHLHEFLPAKTADCLGPVTRCLLTRNCGERAWDILGRALDTLDGAWTTCSDYVGGP